MSLYINTKEISNEMEYDHNGSRNNKSIKTNYLIINKIYKDYKYFKILGRYKNFSFEMKYYNNIFNYTIAYLNQLCNYHICFFSSLSTNISEEIKVKNIIRVINYNNINTIVKYNFNIYSLYKYLLSLYYYSKYYSKNNRKYYTLVDLKTFNCMRYYKNIIYIVAAVAIT